MANSAEYDVIINVITGHLEKATKQLRGMASATGDVSKANKDASKSGREHNDIINGGVASANNGTRGFAKLRESINGSNGLVAAYATLATNAFAVGAAFSALQRAAQAEQIFKGIQEQSTRTGVTLTTVSRNMQALTNYSISASEAMSAAAQVSAAGFSTKSMEDLTQAAANSAAALGRSVPDSLDRFIKGTTKLEPELLDEMGIMVKLEEATSNYAQSMGKLPTQLTATEKRAGYLNAVITESDKKFRGMADAAGANPYDQLSAAFVDLTTNTLNWANDNGVEDFIKRLSSNTELLTATLVLFGSTIVKQIIPGLYGMAAAAAASAAGLAKQAKAQADLVLKAEETAAASRTLALEQARTLKVVDKNSVSYKTYAKALKEGTATEAQKTTALRGLSTQIGKLEQANLRLATVENKTADQTAAIAEREELIKTYKEQKLAIESLATAEANAQKGTEAAQAGIKDAQNKENIAQKAAEAQGSFAQGLEKAGSGDLLGAFDSIKEGLGSLQESYKAAATASGGLVGRLKSGFLAVRTSIVSATTSLYGFITASNGMSRFDTIITAVVGAWYRLQSTILASGGIMNTVKLAFTGLAWSIKAIGTAVLSAIPLVGQLLFVFEMIKEYGPVLLDFIANLFRSEEQKKAAEETKKHTEAIEKAKEALKESQKKLDEAYETGTEVVKRYNDVTNNNLNSSPALVQANTAHRNAIISMADAYTEAYDKQRALNELNNGAPKNVERLNSALKDNKIGLDNASKGTKEYTLLSNIFAQGNEKVNKSLLEFIKNNKDLTGPKFRDFIKKSSDDLRTYQGNLEDLGPAFQAVDKAAQEFIRNLIPSTSVDNLIDQVKSVTTLVGSLREQVDNPVELGIRLSSAGNTQAIKGLLDQQGQMAIAQATALKSYNDQIVARQEAAKKAGVELYTQQQINNFSSIYNKQLSEAGLTIEKSVLKLQAQLLSIQAQERTLESTIALENIRYKMFQRVAGETKESARAEDSHQKRIVDLEASKLKLQMSLLDAQVNSIKLQRTELDLKKSIAQQDKLTLKNNLQANVAMAKVQIGEKPAERVGGRSSRVNPEYEKWLQRKTAAELAAKSLLSIIETMDEDDKIIAKIDEQLKNLDITIKQQSADAISAKKAIQSQISALYEGLLTDQEKSARDASKDLKIAQDESNVLLEINNSIVDTIQKQNAARYKGLPAIVISTKLSKVALDNQLKNLSAETSKKVSSIQDDIETKTATLNSRKLQKDQVQALNAEISLLKLRRDFALKLNEAKEAALVIDKQTELLNLATINTHREGLEMQKKSLDIINAQIDATQSLVNARNEGLRLDAQIAAKKFNKDVDPKLEKQIEITAAKETLKLAEQQLSAKIEGIKLEYALLEAQKVSTILELSMQKKILETKLRASQNGGLSKDQKLMLNQIDNTIKNLSKYSFNAVRDIAIATANQEVENKRKNVVLLETSVKMQNSADNLLTNVLYAIDTANRIKVERERGNLISIPDQRGVPDNTVSSAIPDLSETLKNGLDSIDDTTSDLATIFNKNTTILNELNSIMRDGLKQIRDVLGNITPSARAYLERSSLNTGAPNSTTDIGTIKSSSGVSAQVSKDLVPVFQGFINELEATGYKISRISAYRPGATVKDRHGKDTGRPSAHSIPAAIDINPATNPYTFPGDKNYGQTDMPSNISAIAKKWGLGWGGNWKNSKDTMHFSRLESEGGAGLTPASKFMDNFKIPDHRTPPYIPDKSQILDNPMDISPAEGALAIFTDTLTSASQAVATFKDSTLSTSTAQNPNSPYISPAPSIVDTMAERGSEDLKTMRAAHSVVEQKVGPSERLSDGAYDKKREYYDKLKQGMAKIKEDLAQEGNLSAEAYNKAFSERSAVLSQNLYENLFPAGALAEKVSQFWTDANADAQPFLDSLKSMGPDGELVTAVYSGIQNMSTGITQFAAILETGSAGFEDYVNLASNIMSSVGNILAAGSKAKIANIDKEIAAEQKRDGKSKESVEKIAALEKKKQAEEKKAFERDKKMKMAETVIATAAAVMKAAPNVGKMILMGALGAAQLAIIASSKYEGASTTSTAVSMPSNLSIGKRTDTVDLAKGSNANAGGEVGYLRGSEGTGSNASNYRTVGSAYGGELMRGYGNRGFVVGEKGPEVITPETPISVTPANDVGSTQPINANFTIQALDSHGVQDILVSQKGNIIKMLREAANASGKTFMEDVNVNVYTRPSVGKL